MKPTFTKVKTTKGHLTTYHVYIDEVRVGRVSQLVENGAKDPSWQAYTTRGKKLDTPVKTRKAAAAAIRTHLAAVMDEAEEAIKSERLLAVEAEKILAEAGGFPVIPPSRAPGKMADPTTPKVTSLPSRDHTKQTPAPVRNDATCWSDLPVTEEEEGNRILDKEAGIKATDPRPPRTKQEVRDAVAKNKVITDTPSAAMTAGEDQATSDRVHDAYGVINNTQNFPATHETDSDARREDTRMLTDGPLPEEVKPLKGWARLKAWLYGG